MQARGAPAAAEASQTGVFGPLLFQPPPNEDELLDPPPESTTVEVENGRKRQVDRQLQAAPNGSPTKRPKLSNGYENGSVDAAPTEMEIDQQLSDPIANSNNQAYPSPLEGEQIGTPIIRTDGPEQATQVDKVDELGSEAIFLGLGADDPTGTPQARSGSGNPIVLHCEWNPQDPTMLAAAGTDALARIWTLSRPLASAADPVHNHMNGTSQSFEDLVEEDLPRSATVTSMAWTSDGQAIAVATDAGNKARISIWAPDGTQWHHIEVAEPPVLELKWNPNNQCLLWVAPDHGSPLVTIFSAQETTSASYALREHDLLENPLSVAWTTDNEFVLCGGDVLIALQYNGTEIVMTRKFESQKDDGLGNVQYDPRSRLIATSSDKGAIDVSSVILVPPLETSWLTEVAMG
jgi:transducin (beta)-like 1